MNLIAGGSINSTTSITRNILWNVLGSAAPMVIGIGSTPYLYKQLGVERIGILTLIWAFIGYVSIFDFGLGRAITQRIASGVVDKTDTLKTKTATTGLILVSLIGCVGSVLVFAITASAGGSWIKSDGNIHKEVSSSFMLACLAIPATTATAGLRGVMEGEHRFKTINLLKIILGSFNFLGPVATVYFLGPRLDYTVGAMVFIRYIILIPHYISVQIFLQFNRANLSLHELKLLFKFGGWMTLSNTISPLMVTADRFLVTKVLGSAVVAFYTVPADVMIRLLVLPAAITTAIFPVFSEEISNKRFVKSRYYYRRSIKIIFILMGSIALLISIGSKIGLSMWLGSNFAENSASVVSVLAIGILFNSMAQIPHAYIQASGDSRSTALIHLIESALYLPGLYILLKLYGILGAAIAWMLRALLDLVLLHIMVKINESRLR
jgi:O-antigen/teichoic acid export membrane protein